MRRLRICAGALLAALLVAAAAGAAGAAPANQISIKMPAYVVHSTKKKQQTYIVTISGYSRKRASAYLFLDYTGCARSFAAEHKRAPNESKRYTVRGLFSKMSGWDSSSSGSDHACAYLVSRGSGKLLARARISFTVH